MENYNNYNNFTKKIWLNFFSNRCQIISLFTLHNLPFPEKLWLAYCAARNLYPHRHIWLSLDILPQIITYVLAILFLHNYTTVLHANFL